LNFGSDLEYMQDVVDIISYQSANIT